jgi:5-methyltetrahydropteroyltriglutamate--homocysteine methyltransferase
MDIMHYSTDRILTTHAGSLPRPSDLRAMVVAKSAGEPYDAAALDRRLTEAVAETVRRQRDSGIDVVNDGELSKYNFTDYVRLRIAGYEARPNSGRRRLSMTARDEVKFAAYFAATPRSQALGPPTMPVCTAPLRYVGQAELRKDLDNFTAALAGVEIAGAFLPANTPGTIEHWIANEYYKSDEEFVFAIADAMHEEYRAIVDAGFLLQIDDPDLPDGWACLPDISIADYRKYATLRVDALNHALRGIPKEKVRLHVCWGSFHGPHHDDIPLRDIIDLIFRVNAGSYSIEASNPCHEHEWHVFEDVRLPEGATLIPGVVGHCTDFIEHPDLVAERLVRYARLVGRENVLAGTDCGLGTRVGHESICWAKFEAMAEGARRATKILWDRG